MSALGQVGKRQKVADGLWVPGGYDVAVQEIVVGRCDVIGCKLKA